MSECIRCMRWGSSRKGEHRRCGSVWAHRYVMSKKGEDRQHQKWRGKRTEKHTRTHPKTKGQQQSTGQSRTGGKKETYQYRKKKTVSRVSKEVKRTRGKRRSSPQAHPLTYTYKSMTNRKSSVCAIQQRREHGKSVASLSSRCMRVLFFCVCRRV